MVSPATCGVCGVMPKSPEDQFLYTSLSFEFYGTLYFCEICVAEMARGWDGHTWNEVVDLKAQSEALEIENIKLKAKVDGLEDAVNALSRVRATDPVFLEPLDLESREPEIMASEPEVTESGSEGSVDSVSTGTESVSDKSSNESRPDDSSHSTSKFLDEWDL